VPSPASNVCDTVAPNTALSTRGESLELHEVANNANAPTTTATRDTLNLRGELGCIDIDKLPNSNITDIMSELQVFEG
jgi:hypothetical protein